MLARNIFSLTLIQIGNYLLPFIALPYLSRILGPENFGTMIFAQVFVGYFTLLLNFGFDYTATRDIARDKDNKQIVSGIFFNVIAAKTILFIFSSLIIVIIVFGTAEFNSEAWLFITTHLINIGFVLFPFWLLQGLEKLAIAGIFTLSVKLLYCVGIFLFIRKSDDYLLANLMLSVSQIATGLVAFVFSIKRFGIIPAIPSIKGILAIMKSSWVVFLSQFTINLYTSTNIFLMGLISDPRQTGLYAAVCKIWLVFQGLLLVPFNQSFFPHISAAFHKSLTLGIKKVKDAALVIIFLAGFCSIFIFLLSEKFIFLIFGDEYIQTAELLKIISPLPLIVGLSNIFGLHGLLSLKADKIFLLITTTGATISIVFNLIFLPRFGMFAATWIWLIIETIITFLSFIFFKKTANSIVTKN